jgi:hypothetical protein
MEDDGFGAFADAPAAAALPTEELWPKGDTLPPAAASPAARADPFDAFPAPTADYCDGDSGAAPPPAPRLSGEAQAPAAEHAQEPAADSFGSFTEPANDAQAAAAAAQDDTGFGAFADALAAACDSRTAAPLAAAPAGGDALAPGLVCGSLTDAPAAAPAAAAQADQDDEDDGFDDFADAPAAAVSGIVGAPFAVSSLSNAAASVPVEDEDDDGFGTFAEAPAAAASPSLADEADCFGTFREAIVEPVILAPPSTPVAYTSDLRGLKSPAFMVAAHKLLALDVGAESDAAQTEPSHVAPLDALLRGEAGAPAFVPPSPRMLAAAGLVQGGRSAAGGAPLWEGSPAQRRMHVLLNVTREEVRTHAVHLSVLSTDCVRLRRRRRRAPPFCASTAAATQRPRWRLPARASRAR